MPNFEFELNREFEKVVNDGLKDMARDMQRDVDRLAPQLRGRPLDEAKRRLKQVWEREGGSLTDPELTEYAEMLVDGGKITFTADHLRMR